MQNLVLFAEAVGTVQVCGCVHGFGSGEQWWRLGQMELGLRSGEAWRGHVELRDDKSAEAWVMSW